MALIVHHMQISHSPYYWKYRASSDEVIQRHSAGCHFICIKSDFRTLKCHFPVRVQPLVIQKRRAFKVASFKGNGQHDKPGRERSGSRHSKSQVQISLSHQDGEDVSLDMIDVKEHQISYETDGSRDAESGTVAIQQIFKNWLVMLRTQTSSSTLDNRGNEDMLESTSCEVQHNERSSAASGMLKAASSYFVAVDAAITIPLLVFIPLYLSVRLTYGAEVTSELQPLWILGPLVMALYVKVIQALCRLYYFLFIQAVKLVRNIPSYSSTVYRYLADGKLGMLLYDTFWGPVLRVKNLSYKRVFKWLSEWATELYLDLVESIWPHYCRTIRFLKRARLL